MGQCLKNRNCSKWKGLENFVFTSWGSLALLDPREHGGTSVTAALEPTRTPELGMLQGTGHTEIWDDAESS